MSRFRQHHDFQGFRTFSIDPPWPHRGGGGKAASCKYLTQNVEDLPGIILSAPVFKPAPFAHMYLWFTNNYIEAAPWLMRKLGFDPITIITWNKPRMGIGHYFRGQTEHMLFGVRGDGLMLRHMHTDRKNFTTRIDADFRKEDGKILHSGKPEEAYELVEAASPGPYCEMFSRRKRAGWTVWGNEV